MPIALYLLFLIIFLAGGIFLSPAHSQDFEPAQYAHEHVAGVWQRGYLNGPAAGAMLDIGAMTMDMNGNIYILGGNRVRVITPTGRVWNLAGTGIRGYKDGPAQNAMFNTGGAGYRYEDIAIDSKGNLFVADGINGRIRKIHNSGAQWWVSTYAGGGSASLTPGKTSSVDTVKFSALLGVAVDSSDNVWTTDYACIYKITPSGIVNCYANTAGGPAVMMQADALGNLYMLTRSPNSCFYRISPEGSVVRIAGMQNSEINELRDHNLPVPVDGPALQSTFFAVSHFAVSSIGTIYGGNGDEYVLRRVKDGYTMTLFPDGWRTNATDRNAGWFLGAALYIAPNNAIYLMGDNPPRQLGLRRLVPK